MLIKFFIIITIFFNFFLRLHADEKQLIINKLIDTRNITFDFKQNTNKKEEKGKCVLVFDNKLNCNYRDSMQKEVLINGKTLVVKHNRYNKIYYYPISNSPFMKILNKDNLINLIQKSNYELNDNIELVYLDKNKRKITIFFNKNNYELIGWRVDDKLQNVINFSLKIQSINTEFDPTIFKIP